MTNSILTAANPLASSALTKKGRPMTDLGVPADDDYLSLFADTPHDAVLPDGETSGGLMPDRTTRMNVTAAVAATPQDLTIEQPVITDVEAPGLASSGFEFLAVMRKPIVVVVLAVAAAFLLMNRLSGTTSASTNEGVVAAAVETVAVATAESDDPAGATPDTSAPNTSIEKVLDEAAQWRTSRGSFYGFTPPAGYLLASGYSNLVVSTWHDGTCRMGGLVNGSGPTVADDPTGQACQPAAMTQAQAAIDAAERDS